MQSVLKTTSYFDSGRDDNSRPSMMRTEQFVLVMLTSEEQDRCFRRDKSARLYKLGDLELHGSLKGGQRLSRRGGAGAESVPKRE